MIQIAKLLSEDVKSIASQFANASSLGDSITIANNIYSKAQNISENLVAGMRQVQIVNTRSQKDGISVYDSLAYKFTAQQGDDVAYVKAVANYVASLDKRCEDLELEVMNERARELCFEGKRWYDMHYTYINWVDGRKAAFYALYDITDKNSFNHIKDWIEDVNKYTDDNPLKIIKYI